jgi:hypothetical protein
LQGRILFLLVQVCSQKAKLDALDRIHYPSKWKSVDLMALADLMSGGEQTEMSFRPLGYPPMVARDRTPGLAD